MEKVFDTKYIGSPNVNGGDVYDINIPKKNVTLSNFIEQVTEDNSKSGIVYVKVNDDETKKTDTVCISYTGGKISFNEDKLNDLKDTVVDNDGYMNEAYGSTDYFIKVKK